jgi:hypothetical protein
MVLAQIGPHVRYNKSVLTFVTTHRPIPGKYAFPYILFVWGYLAFLQLYCLQLCLSTTFYVHFFSRNASSLVRLCLQRMMLSWYKKRAKAERWSWRRQFQRLSISHAEDKALLGTLAEHTRPRWRKCSNGVMPRWRNNVIVGVFEMERDRGMMTCTFDDQVWRVPSIRRCPRTHVMPVNQWKSFKCATNYYLSPSMLTEFRRR